MTMHRKNVNKAERELQTPDEPCTLGKLQIRHVDLEGARSRSDPNPTSLPARKGPLRRKQLVCFLITWVLLGGLFFTMISNKLSEQPRRSDDWHVVGVTLRVLSLPYTPDMDHIRSQVFTQTQSTICSVMRSILADSDYSTLIFDCWLESLRPGLLADVSLRFRLQPEEETDNLHPSLKEQEPTTRPHHDKQPASWFPTPGQHDEDRHLDPPITSLNASHVTALVFSAAQHVLDSSGIRWVVGSLVLDPSTLPSPLIGPPLTGGRAQAHALGAESERSASPDGGEVRTGDVRVPPIYMTSEAVPDGTGDAYVTCYVTEPGEWRHLLIGFLDPANRLAPLVTVSPLSEPRWEHFTLKSHNVISMKMTSRLLKARLHIVNPGCQDSGKYWCRVESAQETDKLEAGTDLVVNSQPSVPVLDLPSDAIEGYALPEPIRCQADLGHPAGTLKMFVREPEVLRELTEADGLTLTHRHDSCGLVGELTLNSSPGIHGTELVCVVEYFLSGKRSVVRETSAVWQEIPLSACQGQGRLWKVAHPHSTCNRYLLCDEPSIYSALCPARHCFDPSVGYCVPDTAPNQDIQPLDMNN